MNNTHVCILMATYNGAAHLDAQLDSIRAQSHENWSLWVSDDNSTDATRDRVRAFGETVAQPVHLLDGPRAGCAANFLSLMRHPDLPAGSFMALCDQDDVWFHGRLARALDLLRLSQGAALYASRTQIGQAPDGPRRLSPRHHKAPSLANALIQTIGGGNTMVLTPDAATLVRRSSAAQVPAFHDWWLYQFIMCVGGQVIYDDQPSLFYRQHDENTLGRNRGFAARYARLGTIAGGQYRGWVDANLAALNDDKALFTPDARAVLDRFTHLREKVGLRRLLEWRRLGLHRQRSAETALMALAATMGRV
ncbi:MAG: glycosyltransferase [Paracoccaceae bacterium]